MVIDVGDQIMIKCASASIAMKKNGDITLDGKNLDLTGSGKINAMASGKIAIKRSKAPEN